MSRHKEMLDSIGHGLAVFIIQTSDITDDEISLASRAIEQADSIGPILHPSEWIKAQDGRLPYQRAALKLLRDARALAKARGLA